MLVNALISAYNNLAFGVMSAYLTSEGIIA